MTIFRFAAILAAISCLMATTDAVAQGHGGHMAGGMRGGGAHFAGQAHGFRSSGFGHGGFRQDGFRHDGFRHDGFRHDGFRHDGFRHDGRFFGGRGFGSSFVVIGGIWYPWYSYATPVYANAGYDYYCQSAGAYYPDVTVCPEPWVLVTP